VDALKNFVELVDFLQDFENGEEECDHKFNNGLNNAEDDVPEAFFDNINNSFNSAFHAIEKINSLFPEILKIITKSLHLSKELFGPAGILFAQVFSLILIQFFTL